MIICFPFIITGSKNSEHCLFDYSENHFSVMYAPTQASAGQKNYFQSNQTKMFGIFNDNKKLGMTKIFSYLVELWAIIVNKT